MKALRVTGNIFIVIGATFLFFVVYELVGTAQITRGHQAALAAEFAEPDPLPDPTPSTIDPSPSPSESPEPEPPKPRPRPDPGDAVARIEIPKINIDMIVVEGVSLAQLAKGPGHYRRTVLPGEPGPVGIAGHRTGWGSPFIDLDKLERGDRIRLQLRDGTRYIYEVTNTTVVDPSESWVLNGDPKSTSQFRLTLTTCTPKYTSRNRLIIWADQTREIPADG